MQTTQAFSPKMQTKCGKMKTKALTIRETASWTYKGEKLMSTLSKIASSKQIRHCPTRKRNDNA